jgi:hypothetical protein
VASLCIRTLREYSKDVHNEVLLLFHYELRELRLIHNEGLVDSKKTVLVGLLRRALEAGSTHGFSGSARDTPRRVGVVSGVRV